MASSVAKHGSRTGSGVPSTTQANGDPRLQPSISQAGKIQAHPVSTVKAKQPSSGVVAASAATSQPTSSVQAPSPALRATPAPGGVSAGPIRSSGLQQRPPASSRPAMPSTMSNMMPRPHWLPQGLPVSSQPPAPAPYSSKQQPYRPAAGSMPQPSMCNGMISQPQQAYHASMPLQNYAPRPQFFPNSTGVAMPVYPGSYQQVQQLPIGSSQPIQNQQQQQQQLQHMPQSLAPSDTMHHSYQSGGVVLAGEAGPAPNPQDAQTAITAGAVPVICNGNRGLYLVGTGNMACTCKTCSAAAETHSVPYYELDLAIFERHSGVIPGTRAGNAILMMDHGHPGTPLPLKAWLEQNGYPTRNVRGPEYRPSVPAQAPLPITASQPLPSSSLIRPHYAPVRGPRPARPQQQQHPPNAARPYVPLLPPSSASQPPAHTSNAPAAAAGYGSQMHEDMDNVPVVNPRAGAEKDHRFLKVQSKAADQQAKVPRLLREGPRYQAMLPSFAGNKPPGKEESDKRCGRHVSSEDSMAAAAIEKMRADALPFQAISDPEFHRADGMDPRQLLLERNQRRRQKPGWLQGSIDSRASKDLRSFAALRAAGGDEADLAAMSREESPARAPPIITLAARHSGGVDAGAARKRGPPEVEIVPPAKRSRYMPLLGTTVPATSPLELQVSVPRRMRSGASVRASDLATAAAELTPRSPLQRNNRSLGSSGPGDDRPGLGVRMSDAAAGGIGRRRGAQSRGGSRNGSPLQHREGVTRLLDGSPCMLRCVMVEDMLRIDMEYNGQTYTGALMPTLLPRIPSSARLEHQATHESPHAAASPHAPAAESPLAADRSRLGSEGPQRSITLSVDRKRKATRDPEPDPEPVASAAVKASATRAQGVQTEAATPAQPASTTAAEPPAAQLPQSAEPDRPAATQADPPPAAKPVDPAQPVVQPSDEDAQPNAVTGDSADAPSPAATDEPRSGSPTLGTEEAEEAEVQPEDARAITLAEPEQLQPLNHIQSTVDEEAAAMLAAAAKPDRQAQAQAEYERLKEQGAPANAKCTLCHHVEQEHDRADADAGRASLERQDKGLGPLLLVRVSAIANAWVHAQCLFWSPDIYVDGGSLAGLADAVRRGRMIKCKKCGQKGATLGCHHKSCRLSYHLDCARKSNCLVQGCGDEPYVVACPKHTRIVMEELDLELPRPAKHKPEPAAAGYTLRRA